MIPNIFSFYKNGIISTTPTKEISLMEFLEIIKQPNQKVELIRTLKTKEERNVIKRKLDYVTFGGTFRKRSKKELIKGSGLACFDIDDVENFTLLKEKIAKDKYAYCVFISPSGNGLKLIVKIPEVSSDEEYKQYWISISKYYDFAEGDEANKDISRACYLSVDKEPYFNSDSEVYTDKVESIISQPKISIPSTIKIKVSNDKPSSEFLDKLKAVVSMEQVLRHFGVNTSMNPTNCPFHTCSQRCLSFNEVTAYCHDTDCLGDNSWNIISFVKKVNHCNSKEAIRWLAEFAGMQKEYEQSKEDYLNNQREPKGWACSVSITKMANKYNLTNCPCCSTPLNFNEKMGWYNCSSCKIVKGGLKQFAGLILQSKSNQGVKTL